jgi:hypothetical protein
MASPWEVLGVEEGASVADVRAAHRRLCLRFHPDRFAGAPASVQALATAAMAEVNAAFDVLLAATRGWAPPPPSTELVRYRRPNRWDDALAPAPARGGITDLAA